MKVCVLGCGPAGLLSAYAAESRGHNVVIISKKEKSKIPGAVFLHEPIPTLTAPEPEGVVKFIKHGTKQGYAKKVYGSRYAECSWDLFPEGERPAWSMFNLYNKLWSRYETRIRNKMVDYLSVRAYLSVSDVVISTIPVSWICMDNAHSFNNQGIFILNKAIDKSENIIVYNGDEQDSWYRTSNIFGSESTESTERFSNDIVRQLGAEVSIGYKPINTDCDCLPQVHRVGRFGRWEKGILVHHAYKQTVELLEAL